MTASESVEQLSAQDCWGLLQSSNLGRLAVIRADGEPDIFPVNYVCHEGALYVRTARDRKLFHIAHHPIVAFEIDGSTPDAYWSVVVRGPASRVTDDRELRGSGVRGLVSNNPIPLHTAMKVQANTVTGRRLRRHTGSTSDVYAYEGEATTSATPVVEADALPARSQRPSHIPHVPPVDDRA
ncbi:pyridoxamine 5'-phosphate oxidase family protein [Microbacterium koreense]|uniref:Pyridoxamine 5'-phosphate oxidase family protein n=1 Tax=Microbacterium koreense TaxID=323761 RepID=A0ABW2ZSN4_9MICO